MLNRNSADEGSQMRKFQQGFTLIELMIVVAIIGILAAAAMPNYQRYTKKAKFTEVVSAAMPYKSAMEVAAQSGFFATLDDADGGTNGIPANVTSAVGKIGSVTVADGVITATGTSEVDDKTFIMSMGGVTAPIQWTKTTGSCVSAGIC